MEHRDPLPLAAPVPLADPSSLYSMYKVLFLQRTPLLTSTSSSYQLPILYKHEVMASLIGQPGFLAVRTGQY